MSRLSCMLLIGAVVGLGACSQEVEDSRPGQPVKTRQTAFKEMIKVFEPMGKMLRTNRYEPDRFAALAEELMIKRQAPWAHFGADTNYPPTKAKADVWSQADLFEREKQAFMAATDELLVAARAKKEDAASKAYAKAYDSCQSCHKRFREK